MWWRRLVANFRYANRATGLGHSVDALSALKSRHLDEMAAWHREHRSLTDALAQAEVLERRVRQTLAKKIENAQAAPCEGPLPSDYLRCDDIRAEQDRLQARLTELRVAFVALHHRHTAERHQAGWN